MARRKDASVTKSASQRSSAAIFSESNAEQIWNEPKTKDTTDATKSTNFKAEEEEDEQTPVKVHFIINIIYDFQDLLNNHLTLCKGVQLMVCLYLGQIFYIHLNKEMGMDVISAVGFNFLSAIVAMYLNHRSLLKKHLASPETKAYPELPAFNSLYAFFIPYSFVLLLSNPKDPFFQVNLSLTNFSLKNLHPVAKVLSSLVYNYMFMDSDTLDVIQFAQVVWIYLTVEYALNQWNELTVTENDEVVEIRKTMDATEIHIVAMFMVNLLANFKLPTTKTTMPIVIVRALSIALFAAFALSSPVYFAYIRLQKGVLRSVVSMLLVLTFSATFYFLTNRMFQLGVEKKEVISWLVEFISQSKLRVQLIKSWVLALVVVVPVVFFLASKNCLSLNFRRKIWHFAIVGALMYPALTQEPTFTALAVMGVVFIFITLECLRCTRITFLGDLISNSLHLFQDEKDLQGPLSLSYIFLLVGVAIPIGYGVMLEDVVSMRSYLGIVTLGLGDSFASIIGKRFGKNNWKGESRTVEGTITYIVVTFASFLFIDNYVLPVEARVKNWENMVIVSLVGGVIEGCASLNDNVLIPCMTLIAYELLNKVF